MLITIRPIITGSSFMTDLPLSICYSKPLTMLNLELIKLSSFLCFSLPTGDYTIVLVFFVPVHSRPAAFSIKVRICILPLPPGLAATLTEALRETLMTCKKQEQ